jgi:hypothetical protein
VSGFAGRRILFIGIGFYDYEQSIVERLRACGAIVQACFDRPASLRQGLSASLFRRSGLNPTGLIERHERRILAGIRGIAFDHVLVIKGIDLRMSFLAELRRQQSAAQFILYEWDALARMPGIEQRLPLFDRVLTFDRRDALERPGLEFRPLFFREQGADDAPDPTVEPPVDLCFIGWLHSDRLAMIRRLQLLARDAGLSFLVYLYTGLFTWLRLHAAGNGRDTYFRSLPYAQLMQLNRRARVIVDLPHGAQSGMTMRAIESVGLGRKLLTTATDVQHYDFYAAERVRVLHAGSVQLDPSFVRGPSPAIDPSIRRKYSLQRWLEDVFGISPDAA